MWPFRKSLESVLAQSSDGHIFAALKDRLPKGGTLTPLQQGVLDVWWLLAEAQNGTIAQYLGNSTGNSYARLTRFLQQVGASSTLEAMKEVEPIFPGGVVPADRGQRIQALEAWESLKTTESCEREIRRINDALEQSYSDAIIKTVAYVRANASAYEAA